MKKTITLTSAILGFIFLTGSCEKIDVPNDTPKCIKRKIRDGNKCINKIYEYSYQGETVYLFMSETCPDFFYYLYNKDCKLICKPSGGLSGKGDGKCPVFYQQAINEILVFSK